MERIDLHKELQSIRSRDLDVSSTTVLKTDTLRIVLIALRSGATLPEHHADGRISVQVLEGDIEFDAENNSQRLAPGTIVSLGPRVPHRVVAQQNSALLLTIAWPSPECTDEQAQSAAHRTTGYA